ncbi:MAG: endonuclease/exonuclease/phosphatase family protein [Alistipes sp.]|nr:endonuclease/exonuclease/phosphatase family protein [Alistipes sp.]MBR5132193.1 endonuclease/exonuclease/phosphatase family protein [Alistipes sp.]
MKRFLLILSVMVLAATSVVAQDKPYMVAFWNFENLFDIYNDPETHDDEFTPEGIKKWNETKYQKKLSNLERVIFDMAAINKDYPVVFGVSEIENRSVLEDLVSQPKLKGAKYRICHFDSPDARGVDVAFLYRADVFKLEGCDNIKLNVPELPNFRTRDLVVMWGTIEGEPFYFLVSHWPSRLGGKEASQFKRDACAKQIREIKDSLLQANPATKVVVMGDFNDDATDASLVKVMGAKGKVKELETGDFFNPYVQMLKAGLGTLAYQDSWNLFDNICVTENLVNGTYGKLRLIKGKKFYGNIFTRPYMLQQEGQYKGYPLRTFVTNNFQNGFSDHFPVYIYIGK